MSKNNELEYKVYDIILKGGTMMRSVKRIEPDLNKLSAAGAEEVAVSTLLVKNIWSSMKLN